MTRRHRRWELVGLEDDPVPGDHADVMEVEATYRRRGEGLRNTHTALSRLDQLDGWTGKSAEVFADNAHDILEEVGKSEGKYERAAAALRTYADAVTIARDQTATAMDHAEDAERTRVADQDSLLTGVDDPTPEQETDDEQRAKRVDRAEGRIAAARTAVREALQQLDDAAKIAAGEISSASKSYKDGRWDNFKGFIRSHAGALNKIVDVLEKIAIAIAVIVVVALVVVAIVATGGAAAALFAAVATYAGYAAVAASALLLVGHGAQMIGETSDTSWGDIGMDIVGIATFGAGGALLKGAKGSLGLARTTGMAKLTRLAKPTLPKKAITSLRPGARYNKWATRLLDEARGPAYQGLKGLSDVTAGKMTRLANLNNGLADTTAQLRVARQITPSGAPAAHLDAAATKLRGAVAVNTIGTVSGLDSITGLDLGKRAIDSTVGEIGRIGHHLARTGP